LAANPQPNLLFIAYYYPPINAVGGLRAARFAKYLPEFGYQAAVVAGNTASDLVDSATTRYVPNSSEAPPAADRIGSLAGRLIQRFVTYNSDRLDWVPYAVAGARRFLEAGQIQVVFSSSPPLANHVAALWLRQRYQFKWVADFRDPLVGSPFRPSKRLLRWHDRVLQRTIFSHADGLTTVTDAIAREWSEHDSQASGKASVIWNGFDPAEEFSAAPAPSRAFRVITHAGDLYGGRHPGLLLSSLDRLIRRGVLDPAGIRLELIGPIENNTLDANPAFPRLLELGVLQLNNQRVPREQAMKSIAEADYLLLLDLNEKNVGHTVPAKLFDYLRTGHPILAFTAFQSVVDGILSNSGVPYVPVHPTETADVIDQKVLSFLSLDVKPVQPNEWFRQQFDGRSQAQTLARLLDRLLA